MSRAFFKGISERAHHFLPVVGIEVKHERCFRLSNGNAGWSFFFSGLFDVSPSLVAFISWSTMSNEGCGAGNCSLLLLRLSLLLLLPPGSSVPCTREAAAVKRQLKPTRK